MKWHRLKISNKKQTGTEMEIKCFTHKFFLHVNVKMYCNLTVNEHNRNKKI